MTMLDTLDFRSIKVDIRSPDQSELRKEKALSAFQSLKSARKPDLDLISDAFTFARESKIECKVIDLISIYRTILEMREDLPSNRIAACDSFLDEVEDCLNHFLDHNILPVRKMTVSQIIGPVAELADASDFLKGQI
jgi:hypothetical protein